MFKAVSILFTNQVELSGFVNLYVCSTRLYQLRYLSLLALITFLHKSVYVFTNTRTYRFLIRAYFYIGILLLYKHFGKTLTFRSPRFVINRERSYYPKHETSRIGITICAFYLQFN